MGLPPPPYQCPHCGKVTYYSRKQARRAGKRISPGGHPSAYPCPAAEGRWHWGHLPTVVSRGKTPRENLEQYRK